jgi:thiamine-phosphate pyrophosphorylase
LEYLTYTAERATGPVFVTGGVTPATVAELVAAGARRFVVVRWLTEADDPYARARQLTDAIDAALAGR